MALTFVYLIFRQLLAWLAMLTRDEAAKTAEIPVLRHKNAILRRRVKRPRRSWADRAVIAALAGLLPKARRMHLFVTPSTLGNIIQLTNLTGHPCVVLPNGFNPDNTPVSLSFIGGLYKEAETLRVAKAYQDQTDFHRKHPTEFVV